MISWITLASIAVTFLLTLAASWAVLAPLFFSDERDEYYAPECDLLLAKLMARKETIFVNLEELEHDYLAKKLEKSIYQVSREKLMKEATICLAEIDAKCPQRAERQPRAERRLRDVAEGQSAKKS